MLGVPRGIRSTVFRLIESRLKCDPVLKGAVAKWYTWDGAPESASGQAVIPTPSIRLTPALGPVTWYGPAEHGGMLQIKIDLLTRTLNADDPLDLWEAIERAIYPASRTEELAWEQSLRDAHAWTGQINLSQPTTIQQADDNQILSSGLIEIEIHRILAP